MDNFSWDVIIRLATQGAKGSAAELTQVGNAVDTLNRQGKLAEKSVDSLSRGIVQAGRSASTGASNNQKYAQSLNSIRYANYDVASSMFTLSGAIAGFSTATVVAFASQESAFTSVERIVKDTTDNQIDDIGLLREQLQALSTEIPKSFQDLSGIAALGAALDIPADSLERFTEIVAKFSATAGSTEDAAASGFGRIAAYFDLDPSQYEAVGSAILKAGNVAIATEDQVLKYSEALSLAGSRAGFTADQTIGLAAGIASFGKINVEGAGSALSRITAQIDLATAEGGEKLENFALVAGMSAEEFQRAWSADSFGTFNDILRNLSGVENANLVLKELGVNNERDARTILALAQNYQKFNGIVQQTSQAYREGTYLNESYAKVLDDLNSQWTIFINAVTNAAAAVGSSLAPNIVDLLGFTTQLLVAFADFAASDAGQFFFRFAGTVALAVGAFAALRGAIALATGTALALQTAVKFIGPGLIASIRGLGSAFGIVGTGAAGATGGVNLLRGALLALGRATLIIGLFQLAAELIFNFGGTMKNLLPVFNAVIDGITAVARAVIPALQGIAGALSALPGNLGAGFGQINKVLGVIAPNLDKISGVYKKQVSGWVDSLNKAQDATGDFSEATGIADASADDLGDSLDGLGDSADDAAAKVRTLVDYANDLSSVFTRAFDIRFGGQSTLDTVTKTFIDLRTAAEDSARSIQKMKAELQGLNADLNTQQYFLGIAIEYGDSKRAEVISARIAELQSQIADKTADLNKEQSANSKELQGNTSAAIANRETIRGLVQQYQAHLAALASSGLSQDQLAIATEQLRQDFITQATQLGYNRGELALYEQSFYDVSTAIANVPRDITVTANANPALQALNEFAAQAAAQMASAGTNSGNAFGNNFGSALNNTLLNSALGANIGGALGTSIANSIAGPLSRATGGGTGRARPGGGSFATGGYTGAGGRLTPAGIVHRGEYVVPKHEVNQRTGLPFADALGRLQRGAQGRTGYAGGGYVSPPNSGGRMVVDLSAMSIQQIGMVMDKVISVGGEVIATTASKQYAKQTAMGDY